MKKILTILFIGLLLIGCTKTNTTTITNGKDVIYKNKNTQYTKADLFNGLKGLNYSYIVLSDMIKKVSASEGIDLTKYEQAAEETMELYKQLYGIEDFDDYGGDEAFKSQLVTEELILDRSKDYIKNHINDYVSTDSPIKGQMAYFDSEKRAQAVINAVSNNSSTFDMAVLDNGYNYSVLESLFLSTDSSIPQEVKDYVFSKKQVGISEPIEVTTTSTDSEGNETSTTSYYVFNTTSVDYNEFLDEYLELKASSVDTNSVLKEMFANYKIEFNDLDTYNTMTQAYPGVFE